MHIQVKTGQPPTGHKPSVGSEPENKNRVQAYDNREPHFANIGREE